MQALVCQKGQDDVIRQVARETTNGWHLIVGRVVASQSMVPTAGTAERSSTCMDALEESLLALEAAAPERAPDKFSSPIGL